MRGLEEDGAFDSPRSAAEDERDVARNTSGSTGWEHRLRSTDKGARSRQDSLVALDGDGDIARVFFSL